MSPNETHTYSYLDQLSPTEVFELLTQAAKVNQGRYLEHVRILFTGTAPYKFVTLEVPDPQSGKHTGPEAQQEIHSLLIGAFTQMTGRRERYTTPGGESKAILEGIAWLLLKSANAVDEVIAGTKGDEYLVVTREIDAKEAETIFKKLNFHATSTRVSSVISRHGASRYLYYVKDDHRRKSSFSSIVAGDFFKDHSCRVLKGYESQEQVLFFPEEVQPGEQKLHAFTRLLEEAPLLFGIKEEKNNTGPVAAIVQWPGTPSIPEQVETEVPEDFHVELLFLGEIRFFKQELFTVQQVGQVRFEYVKLQESKTGLDDLEARLKQMEPESGYRLELRGTKYLEKNRLERLLDQKARLDHNIAYLQSITVPQPVLLRFTHKHLPVMATWIRGFPLHVLHEGKLKYGFQATEKEPAGNHYILMDIRETQGAKLDLLPLWQEPGQEANHVCFRLDPFWAGHYFEAGGDSLVFVPMGSAVFPPIHDWERGNMDRYLRETMAHWFNDRLKGQIIPNKPIYIFDGQPESSQPIEISILDQERMEPLHMKLGWINDNLLLHHALEKEEQISQLVKEITWNELTRKFKSEAEKSRNDFTETAREVSNQMAQTTTEMTRVLTNEIDRVVKETFRMTQKIKKMEQRLTEWDNVLSDMNEMLQEIQQQKQDVSFQEGISKNVFWRFEQQILREIQSSERRRNDLEARIDGEITKMQTTVRKLKQRLKHVKL